ncbi:uncharacterized protein A4U43_C05F34550 [Asparagus officinalis]|uniref:Uncharacterized protein n=1 Tax=Asparagus officinalis TaxID=4686 RepID=A0A5P1F264_ASPOF|nr:uncharacterized protein A4U43_C05F34550 [Asparagus officinalis]
MDEGSSMSMTTASTTTASRGVGRGSSGGLGDRWGGDRICSSEMDEGSSMSMTTASTTTASRGVGRGSSGGLGDRWGGDRLSRLSGADLRGQRSVELLGVVQRRRGLRAAVHRS